MSQRFINCTACKGCHTGRGGQYCKFVSPVHAGATAGTPAMAMAAQDVDTPDRDSPEYLSYLKSKIEEEEDRLKYLQDQRNLTSLEDQLARLRLQSTEFEFKSASLTKPAPPNTGMAADLLTAAHQGGAWSTAAQVPVSLTSPQTVFMQRSREERDMLSKLRATSHLSEQKPIEKITYRDFICAMAKVLKMLTDLDLGFRNYVAHMGFITSKAALDLYATDAIIRYEAAVTDRVITGQYQDWVAADPECVALHLGADATYTVRQGGSRWPRQNSGNSGGSRDFADWPKEICWLFNNTNCYFPCCQKAHICFKCKRTGHNMKDCKNSDEQASPSSLEVASPKPQKEIRKA